MQTGDVTQPILILHCNVHIQYIADNMSCSIKLKYKWTKNLSCSHQNQQIIKYNNFSVLNGAVKIFMALFLVVDNEEHLRILQILKVGLEDEPCISM